MIFQVSEHKGSWDFHRIIAISVCTIIDMLVSSARLAFKVQWTLPVLSGSNSVLPNPVDGYSGGFKDATGTSNSSIEQEIKRRG